MNPDRWQRMWEIFHAARGLSPAQRDALLDRECGGDEGLRGELEGLLAEAEAPSAMLEQGALGARARDHEPGERIGPYLLERILGEGGMGVVYEASQSEPVARRVALKVVRAGLDTREVLARFETEKQALAILEHPSIARVLDAGVTESGRPYFAMELVQGREITAFCDEHGLDTFARLELFESVCDAVQHAHRRGVIHRDLKPSNILVSMQGSRPLAKIIDFGIARATHLPAGARTLFTEHGRIIGTPEYMSPEQAGLTGEDIDTRTDVYALGVVLYELLVGAQPFDWRSLREAGFDEIRRIIREEDPPRPSRRLQTLGDTLTDVAERRRTDPANLKRSLSGDLDWVVMRCLEKDRERRYETPHDVVADLERYRTHRPVEACPPTLAYRLAKFARRHRAGVAAGSAVVLALVVGAGLGAAGYLRALQAEQDALRSASVAGEVSDFLTEIFEVSMPNERDVDSVTARQLLERGAEKITEGQVEDPEVRARLLFTLGKVYIRIGMSSEGRKLLEEAREITARVVGVESEEMVGIVNMLGAAEYNEARFTEAETLYREALELERARGGDEPSEAAEILDNLAMSMVRQGRREEARALMLENLEALIAAEGGNSDAIALPLLSLAIVETEMKLNDEARGHLTRALDLLEASRDPDDPQVQYAVNSMGILEWQTGRYEQARPYFERSLASIRRTHGEDHHITASMMANNGRLLMELEEYEKAEELTREAIRRFEARKGSSHPFLATYLLNLAQILRRTDRHEDALPLYSRAMGIKEEAYGVESPELVRTLRSWAELMDEVNDEKGARTLRERATRIESLNEAP